jgi:hypothetical protein
MTRTLIMAITMMAAALSVAVAQPLRHYGNARFNYWVDYPASLVAGPEPANGDGRAFTLRSGRPGSISISGMYNASDETTAQIADEAAQDCGAPVAYRLVKPRLAAISCVQGARIHYRKTVLMDDDVLVTLAADYPRADAAVWDRIVAQMSASMRQGHR